MDNFSAELPGTFLFVDYCTINSQLNPYNVLFVDFIWVLSAVILWFLLFIHRHFDSTPQHHDSLFVSFSVKIEVSILTESGCSD